MTPTLALGISAPGAAQVAKLAEAVGQLQGNLASLAKTAGSTGLGDLDKIAGQMTRMRREMGVAIAGIRTELAAGFTKAFTDASKATDQGGEKLADATKKAAAKVKVAAQAFDLGGGVKASISGSGIDALGNVRKLQEEFAKRADVIAVGAEKLSQAQVLARAKLMKGSYDIAQGQERAAAVEYSARMAWVGKMQLGSLKYQETADQAAAREERARASWRIKMTKGAYDLAQDQAKAGAAEYNARMAWMGKLQTGSLKIQESIEKTAEREDRAKTLWRIKLMMGSMRLSQEIKDAADREARAMAEANAKREAANYKQVQLATARPVGAWSGISSQFTHNLKPSTDADAVGDTARRAKVATDNMRAFSSSMHDAHSAARGLASGFGMMWLTWGRIAPLLAGAAVSHAVAKSFDVGSEVSYNTKFMQIMSDQTVEASQIVREELRKINEETKFTLTDLSQAMVNLGQAGKTPQEALQMIKPLADLATVGMTDMKTATDLVIQAQALFGLSAADTDKLVSQLYLTTKSGAVNIEHLGGSMKYASEANTRFGVSVEETLTVLKGLGDAGLKSSSGGTSFINFLRDLHGRSGPAIKALEDLRKASGKDIKLYDVDEKGLTRMRSVIPIFKDIAEASGKLKFEDQDRILAKLFSDRGGRTFFSMIRDGSVNLEKFKEELVGIDRTLASKSAKALQEGTAKGQVDILKSNLSNTMDAVFERFESGFIETLKKVSQIVNSTGFKEFLASAIGSVHALTNAVIAAREPLMALGAAWLGFKVLTLVTGLFQTAASALAGWTAQQVLAGAAAKATTGAMAQQGAMTIALAAEQRALSMGMTAVAAQTAGMAVAAQASTGALRGLAAVVAFLANPLVGIITTLALFGTAWYTASQYADQGTRTITDAVQKNGALNVTQFQKEINLLRERNALLGISEDPYAGAEKAMMNSNKVRQAKMARVATIDNSPYANSAANVAERARIMSEVAEIDRSNFSAAKMLDRARTADYLAEQKAAADAKAKQERLLNGLGQNPNAPGVGGAGRAGAGKPEKSYNWRDDWKGNRQEWLDQYDRTIEKEQALQKAADDTAKANAAYTKTIEDQVRAVRDSVGAAEDDLLFRGKSKVQIEEINLLRLKDIANQQYMTATSEEDLKVILAKIAASEKLIGIYKEGELLDLNDKAAKEAAEQWKQVGNSLVDNLMRGGKSVRDYLHDLFRTLVLRPILQPIGTMAVAGAQSVLGMGASSGGGIMSSVGSSLLGNAGTSMLGTALGTTLTGTMGGTFGAGIMGGLGVGGTGYSLTGGLQLASSLFSSGSVAGGIGAVLGALGPIALGVGALIALTKSKGGPKSEIGYGYNIDGINNRSWNDAEAKTMAEGIEETYKSLAERLGLESVLKAGVFVSRDPAGDSLTQLQVAGSLNGRGVYARSNEGSIENVGRSDEEFKAALEQSSFRLIMQALLADEGLGADYKSRLNSAGDGTTDELKSVIEEIAAVKQLRDSLKLLPFEQLKTLSYDATIHLSKLAGGLEALGTSLQTYYTEFYSESERTKILQQGLTNEMKGLGFAMPKTRQEFRLLVEAQDLSTDSGRKTYNSLLQMSSALASLYPALETTADKIARVDEARSILEESYSVEVERLKEVKTQMDAFADSLAKFLKQLTTGPLAALSPEAQYLATKAEFSNVAARARTGDAKALEELQGVSEEYLNASQAYYASSENYFTDLAEVKAAVQASESVARSASTTATTQLAALNAQVQLLIKIDNGILSVANAIANLRATAAAAGVNPNLTNTSGTASGPASVDQIARFDSILGNSKQNAADYGRSLGYTDLQIAQHVGGNSKYGTSEADALAWLANNPVQNRAVGGYTPPGLTWVGEDGPELLNLDRPAQVYSAVQSREMTGAGSVVSVLTTGHRIMSAMLEEQRAMVRQNSAAYQAMITLMTDLNQKATTTVKQNTLADQNR